MDCLRFLFIFDGIIITWVCFFYKFFLEKTFLISEILFMRENRVIQYIFLGGNLVVYYNFLGESPNTCNMLQLSLYVPILNLTSEILI